MSIVLPRGRFRNASTFGAGRRVSLDRNQRARFVWLVRQDRRNGRLSATGEDVGLALVAMLGEDGRLDPSHETIRRRVGCRALSTVQEALNRLRDLGRLTWERRLLRRLGTGWRAAQTSNAYVLLHASCDTDLPRGVRFNQKERSLQGQTTHHGALLRSWIPTFSESERAAAQAALEARRTAVNVSLAQRTELPVG